MALFMGTWTSKVDGKGRVSIPASFRAALVGQPFQGVVLYPALDKPALEGCGLDRMQDLMAEIERNHAPFSPEYEAMTYALLGQSQQLTWDEPGRIVLPTAMRDLAGIGESAVFAGLGRNFEIWEPAAFEAVQAERRRLAAERRGQRAAPPSPGAAR